jgi:hypothetical protein
VLVESLIALAVVIVLLAFGVPMRCQGSIARPPFRGCRKRVGGFLGYCRVHGFQPSRRLMSVFGGQQLTQRTTCAACGRPTVFCRMQVTGKPFLGCTGFPGCKNPRWLDS